MWTRCSRFVRDWPRPPVRGCRPEVLCARWTSKACFKNTVVSRKGANEPSLRKQLLGSELRGLFEDNRVVAVYHYNDLSTEDWKAFRLKLRSADVKIRVFPSKVAAKSLEGTRFRNISTIFKGCTAIAYGKDPLCLPVLLSSLQSEPKLQLMGGLFDNQLFTLKGLKSCSTLQCLDTLRGELSGLLMLSAAGTAQALQASATRLSRLLNHIV